MDPLELQRLLALPGVSIPKNGPTPDWMVANGIPQLGQQTVAGGKMDKLPYYDPSQPMIDANAGMDAMGMNPDGSGVYEPVPGAPYEQVADAPVQVAPAAGYPPPEYMGIGTEEMTGGGPQDIVPSAYRETKPVEGSWDSFMRRPGMGNALLNAGAAILGGRTPLEGLSAGGAAFGQSLEERRRYDQGREDADLDRMLRAQIAQARLSGGGGNKLGERIQAAEQLGLKPGSPEFVRFVGQTDPFDKAPSAADVKTVEAQREKLDDITFQEGKVQALMDMLPNMYHNLGAGAMGWLGTSGQSIGGTLIADPEKAKYTVMYNKLLEPEAIKTMAETLKGATTNFEMDKFIKLMSSADTSIEIKQAILGEMMEAIQIAKRRAKGEPGIERYNFDLEKYSTKPKKTSAASPSLADVSDEELQAIAGEGN